MHYGIALTFRHIILFKKYRAHREGGPDSLFSLFCFLEEYHRQEVCDDGRSGDADEARHHERVVEQVFADDGGAGAVEVDGGDIRRIVGDEEISVNRRKYA